MSSRTDLVSELVRNPKISEQAIQALKAFGWDCDETLVTVKKKDVLSVLADFSAGRLTEDEVQSWASRIESRDDVDYEHGPEGVVNEAVFWLANPGINYPINAALCDRIAKAFFDVEPADL